MTWAIMILDLPFTTPMLSETSKRKNMRFWSIGLFFYPSIAFFYQTQILIRINILFPGPPKDYFALCFEPLRQEEQFPVWGEAFCLKFTHLPEIAKWFWQWSNWCDALLVAIALKTLVLLMFFKRNHRMCWKEICTASDSRGCVWKWWFTWISYQHGHQLVISGDNDKDDN